MDKIIEKFFNDGSYTVFFFPSDNALKSAYSKFKNFLGK